MSPLAHVPLLESLELRRYAASTETITPVADTSVRSRTVVEVPFAQLKGKPADPAALPRLRVIQNAMKDVTIQGNVGDDGIRVRVVRQGLEIRTTTLQTYRYFVTADRFGRRQAIEKTVTFDNVVTVPRGQYGALTINGGKGKDSLRYSGGLSFVPVTSSVETETPQTYPAAPAGQTPSDPAVRPSRSWANQVVAERARADAIAASPAAEETANSSAAFFGDSYVENFPLYSGDIWNRFFKRGKTFGIGGDTTRHALFRLIKNGLFDVYKPHKLVVSIGTNDLNDPRAGGTDEQVFKGIVRVMNELRKRLPETRIVLVSLIPRFGAGLNQRIEAINAMLDKTDFGDHASFLDLYNRFSLGAVKFRPDRNYAESAYDIVTVGTDSHYTRYGYRILAYNLDAVLAEPVVSTAE